jgi:hypothetical protein
MKATENIITDLLSRMSPTLDKMLQRIKIDYEKRYDRAFTSHDKKLTRLLLEKDIVKSFSTYTQPIDILKTFKIAGSKSGQLVISAIIERDSIEYQHETSVIYAGGYNVQRLHYRYLTKSDLPKTGDVSILKKFTEAIKVLNKIESIEQEIISNKKQIDLQINDISTREKMSDQDILNASESYKKFSVLTWDDMIERECTKNFDFDENVFLNSQKENRERTLSFYKSMTNSKIVRLAYLEKASSKLKEKLAKTMEN